VLERHESAIEIRRALGDEVGRGGALVRASSQLAAMGRVDESRRALAEAIDVLEALPPGRDLANAYAHRAQEALFAGDVDAAMRDADRTIHLLGDDSADELVTMALHIRGDARCSLGEREGLDDLVRALELARTTGRSGDVVTSENYVGEWFWAFEGPAVAAPHFRNAIAIADRDGNVSQGVWAKAAVLPLLYELGLDTELLLLADEVLALGRDRLDATVWAFCHVHRSNVLLDRDQLDEVVDAGELLAQARAAEDVQAVAPSLLVAARIEQAHGRKAVAADHVRAFAEVTRDVAHEYRETALASAGRLCLALGLRDVLAATIEASEGAIPHHRCNLLSARACLAELDGEADTARAAYLVAADAWDRFGSPREASFAREGADRCSSLV
jgi:hypothetical protein